MCLKGLTFYDTYGDCIIRLSASDQVNSKLSNLDPELAIAIALVFYPMVLAAMLWVREKLRGFEGARLHATGIDVDVDGASSPMRQAE